MLTEGKLGKDNKGALYYFCNFSKSLQLFRIKSYIKRAPNNIGNILSVCILLVHESAELLQFKQESRKHRLEFMNTEFKLRWNSYIPTVYFKSY